MRLEVVVMPVADVDQAKNVYQALGWREDADYAAGADVRVVQLTLRARHARSSAPESPRPRRAPLRGRTLSTRYRSLGGIPECKRSLIPRMIWLRPYAVRRPRTGRHEEQIGHPDPDWPDWYTQYLVDEQTGHAGPAGRGAST